ncbi:MAG: hypothetical protein H0V18_00875 [Pyrinomonadaceae bacterium]|nr:hypothetical protein [Pyrinomonadaceae bacterium]
MSLVLPVVVVKEAGGEEAGSEVAKAEDVSLSGRENPTFDKTSKSRM